FKILISNLSKDSKIKASAWDSLEFAGNIYAFIGVVNPTLFSSGLEDNFTSMSIGIKKSLEEIQEKFKDKKIKYILLSHSGLDEDEKLAKNFPQLDWIIGSHTQSFLRDSNDIGKTRIAQVLSRNHY